MRTTLILFLVACGGSPANDTDAATSDVTITHDGPSNSTTVTIPTPTGTCPTLAPGDVTFAPAGIPARKIKLAFDPAKVGTGPLIIYWYATGSSTQESAYSLGATLQTITAAGGIVATPYADPTAGQFEWFIVNQSSKQDDFFLADELVGCLAQAHMIDPLRVHSMGMSAGALQTTAMSFIRAEYIASVATYSGGVPAGFTTSNGDPANKFAAMIFDGGTTDNVFSVDFKAASENYKAILDADGHFTAICDHNMGHSIPLDAAPSVAMFFAANPWGAWPSPYKTSGLPASFPSYCTL